VTDVADDAAWISRCKYIVRYVAIMIFSQPVEVSRLMYPFGEGDA
jgi:hypothetical protein